MKKSKDTEASMRKWHAEALEVLAPLRWHLNEIIESARMHDAFIISLTGPCRVSRAKIKAAIKAANRVERFFSRKPKTRPCTTSPANGSR